MNGTVLRPTWRRDVDSLDMLRCAMYCCCMTVAAPVTLADRCVFSETPGSRVEDESLRAVYSNEDLLMGAVDALTEGVYDYGTSTLFAAYSRTCDAPFEPTVADSVPHAQGEMISSLVSEEIEDGVALLSFFQTRQDAMGCGVGSALLEEVLSRLESRGCTSVLLDVEGGNERLVSFYSRFGFELTGEEQILSWTEVADDGTVAHVTEPALVMECRLMPGSRSRDGVGRC